MSRRSRIEGDAERAKLVDDAVLASLSMKGQDSAEIRVTMRRELQARGVTDPTDDELVPIQLEPRRLRWTVEPGDRRTEVQWVLVVGGYAVVGVGLLAVAGHLRGPWRYILGGVGVIGVGIAAVCIAGLALCALLWCIATGTLRERPTPVQRTGWGGGALLLGGTSGLGTYEFGPSALIGVVATFIILAGAANTLPQKIPATPEYVRRRLTVFVGLLSLAALASGMTVLL